MKICIPIADRPEGGMYTFIDNFRRWMDANGVTHTQDENDPNCTAVLANAWVVSYRRLAAIKRRKPGVAIVHRIDGSAQDYGRNDGADALQCRANLAADLTIFQSAYSRLSTTEKFRLISRDGPVIYNPVDAVRFSPDGPAEKPAFPNRTGLTIACVSFSSNPRKGTGRIAELATAVPDANFVLCGNFPDMPARANIVRLGYVQRDRLPFVLRGCDLYVHLAENDPCPNVVLEALASGLPVIYRNSGGTPELVGDCGLAIDEISFPHAVAQLRADLPAARAAARKRAVSQFAGDVIFPRYIETIRAATPGPVISWAGRVRLALAGYPVFPGASDAKRAFGAARARLAAKTNA